MELPATGVLTAIGSLKQVPGSARTNFFVSSLALHKCNVNFLARF